jgi:hypothetical protein
MLTGEMEGRIIWVEISWYCHAGEEEKRFRLTFRGNAKHPFIT